MEVIFEKFYPNKIYNGNREGFAKVVINNKLSYLYVIARDKETGNLKAFPPGQKNGDSYLKCFVLPFETSRSVEKIVLENVNKLFESLPENQVQEVDQFDDLF